MSIDAGVDVEVLRKRHAAQEMLGRQEGGQRYGPRPLDLDIIFYGQHKVETERVEIPHPRWQERNFVKACPAILGSLSSKVYKERVSTEMVLGIPHRC